MDITKTANRIANLHYPDIPKTRGDKMFRRQRVIELQKLVESELKNCSMPDVRQLLLEAYKKGVADGESGRYSPENVV